MKAFTAPRIFDGEAWHENAALIVDGANVAQIFPAAELPVKFDRIDLKDGFLAPGFVDLQVNGGGGVMFNDRRDAEAIRTICAAHARFGTTALLATLITDTPEITAEAIAAGAEAARQEIPGFLGLHLEGPHLSVARKGAHDPKLIRPMEDADLAALVAARANVPVLLTTVATESVSPAQIEALTKAGLIVSLGHTDASFRDASAAADAGAAMATHLFNAMSQLGNREPGMVGAALHDGRIHAGLIADGIHVATETIAVALKAKNGPGRIFLVTDAMSPIGTDLTSFTLNGRTILRRDGRLTLEDGTLAGADLDMISAVRFMHETIGLGFEEALRMATVYPARAVGVQGRYGRLGSGSRADFIHLSNALTLHSAWIGGEQVWQS